MESTNHKYSEAKKPRKVGNFHEIRSKKCAVWGALQIPLHCEDDYSCF